MAGWRQRLGFLALFVVAAVLAWRWAQPPPVVVVAAAPVEPAGPAPVPPKLPDAPEPAAAAPAPPTGDPFCTRDGEESEILIEHTLQRFVHERARDAALDAATRGLLKASFDVPAGIASDLYRRADAQRSAAGDSVVLAVVRAVAAQAMQRVDLEREALRAAFGAAPADPAVAWATADAFRHSPEIGLAVEALSSYLAHGGENPALARLRARLEVERDIEKGYRTLERDGISLVFPPDSLSASAADDLLRTVVGDIDEASRLVGTTRRAALTVVVYPGREEILAVTCVKSWAAALYDGSLRVALEDGAVDRRVLRHETLHAALTPTAPKAPLWFDEGVAQHFAHEDHNAERRWALMVKSGSWIPFASMNGTFQVFDAHDDVALLYAQSLAMVELLVERGRRDAIAQATAQFREGWGTRAVLASALGHEVTGDELLEFLRARVPAAVATSPAGR